jgi:hypothetical protein
MFGIIAVVFVLALLFMLSSYRFRERPGSDVKGSGGSVLKDYFSWIGYRSTALLKVPWVERAKELYRNWIIQRYPPAQRWVFIGLALSVSYLTLSGFLFALLRVRIFGLFLLLHVVLGGIFAVCLCLAVILRARYYVWDPEDFKGKKGILNLKTRLGVRMLWQIIFFWTFVASGFMLILTALSQMLPSFSLRTQLVLFEVHRYAALGLLLSVIAFFYFSVFDEGR